MIDEDVAAFYHKILDLTEEDSELHDELLALLEQLFMVAGMLVA